MYPRFLNFGPLNPWQDRTCASCCLLCKMRILQLPISQGYFVGIKLLLCEQSSSRDQAPKKCSINISYHYAPIHKCSQLQYHYNRAHIINTAPQTEQDILQFPCVCFFALNVLIFQLALDYFTQVLRGEITPLKENVSYVNDLARQLTTLGIQLSPYNLNILEDLNTRWKLLQVGTLRALQFLVTTREYTDKACL